MTKISANHCFSFISAMLFPLCKRRVTLPEMYLYPHWNTFILRYSLLYSQKNVAHQTNNKEKMTLNCIIFFSYWKTSDLHLEPEDKNNKRIVLKSCLKNHLKIFLAKICKILHTCTAAKHHLCFHKTLQIKLLLSRLMFKGTVTFTRILEGVSSLGV